MKVLISVLAFIATISIYSTADAQDEATSTGNVNILLGQRNLDEGNWEPVEEQGMFAIEVDFAKKGWPVNILIGLAGSWTEETVFVADGWNSAWVDVEGSTSEFYAGLKKYFRTGTNFTPYIGGGVSRISAEMSASAVGSQYKFSGSDSSMGLFINGGGVFSLGAFNIGLDLRFLTGTSIEIAGTSATADYTQLALVLGYGW